MPVPDGRGELMAGAFARNINPTKLPVWVNGGIAGRELDRISDPLHARSLVLSDGTEQIAICIVDSCILPLDLVDDAKKRAQAKTGIDASHIMIAATHTHSAVSVSGAHGTPVQEDYAAELPEWIADSIDQAFQRQVKAKWGTTSVVCDKFIYCRDWLMKPGTANSSPFSGRTGDAVSMNPGHDNPNKLAPVGPVDMLVPVLSIQDLDGNPISVLATFCTHYAGAPNISADYFAVVCNRLGKELRPNSPDAFVGLMSNSTSGNANCIDFSKPAQAFTHFDVGNYVADQILSVLPKVEYSSRITIDAELKKIELAVRMPSGPEIANAQRYIETHFPDRLPTSMDENYARETVLLSQMPPTRILNLQGFRLNDFVITANPCESYNETGLKIRQASPFPLTMNVGLANGHAGYLPPPEMFQLGGYTTWRCRSSCLEEQAEPKVVQTLTEILQSLHVRRASDRIISSQSIPSSPIAPSESLQWMETEPGFEVELVASEPQIVDPVSMQIDEKGRIWVVEMRDYPTPDNEPKSRIVLLQDKENDGFFESSTVFASGLLFATGVQPWQDGALVTVQGKLLFLRDTDGDLQADTTEVWLDGFAEDNPQLRANHPIIAGDGWLYIASGLRGGKIKNTIPFAKVQNQIVDLTGCDLRVNMVTGEIEAIAGPSQFGLSFDRLGHRYGCSNRQPCFEIRSELKEINASPLAGMVPAWQEVSPGESASRVHPLVNSWTTSNLHAGQFTAACGAIVTHSRHFSSSAFATALTCEPTGGLVQRKTIERNNGRSRIVDEPSDREWLASRDPWFRPVDLYEGPSGDIYVVDMYRAVIEHPDWVPAELKNRPDQRLGDAHGRIYRIKNSQVVDKQNKRPTSRELAPGPPPQRLAFAQWINHSDYWNRSIATRRFLERVHRGELADVIALLKSELLTGMVLKNGTNHPLSGYGFNTCMLLTTCGGVDSDVVDMLFSSKQPMLRTLAWNTLRESNAKWDERWLELAIQTFQSFQDGEKIDEQRAAAWYLAFSKQKWNALDKDTQRELASSTAWTLISHGNDPHLWLAVTAAMKENLPAVLEQYSRWLNRYDAVASKSADVALDALFRTAIKIPQSFDEKEYKSLIETCTQTLLQEGHPFSQNFSLALLEGMSRAGKLSVSPDSELEQRLHRWCLDDSDLQRQRYAVALLSAASSDSSKEIALKALEAPNVATAKQAIATCEVHGTSEFDSWLIENFPSALPALRQSVFQAIRSNPKRLALMVDRLEKGTWTTKLFDASQLQSLLSVRDSDVASRLSAIIAASVPADRQKVIDEYSAKLSSIRVDSKSNAGKAVFEKNCISCHRLNGAGLAVGPDISDSREQSFEKLLISILDPNRAIDANYFRYLARTTDGSTTDGILKDANAQSITLQNQNGSTTLKRSDIEELKSSGTSLMPVGIESQIPPQEMAELLWYIKNWRYVTENIPANAELQH
jgi:putative membrane-bound dehydrogenase-like protein